MHELPKNIAIIMDGNGRWGKQKAKNRNIGHQNGVKVIEKIRSYYGEQPIPTTEPTEDLGISQDEIKGMVADKRYGKDPAFTAKVEKLFERAFPGEYKP